MTQNPQSAVDRLLVGLMFVIQTEVMKCEQQIQNQSQHFMSYHVDHKKGIKQRILFHFDSITTGIQG